MIRVNDFAPPSEPTTLFCKRVTDKKSDGFAAVFGQTVLVVDSGTEDDYGILNYLLYLRETWLSGHPQLLEDVRAKLVVWLFITHTHTDHIPAVFHLVRHPFLRVEKVYAQISHLSFGEHRGIPLSATVRPAAQRTVM